MPRIDISFLYSRPLGSPMIEIVEGINGIGKIGDTSQIISIDDIIKF
jgi:hypothetical protein